jgi:hypothetical protein
MTQEVILSDPADDPAGREDGEEREALALRALAVRWGVCQDGGVQELPFAEAMRALLQRIDRLEVMIMEGRRGQ